jgi:hypothetical protein
MPFTYAGQLVCAHGLRSVVVDIRVCSIVYGAL